MGCRVYTRMYIIQDRSSGRIYMCVCVPYAIYACFWKRQKNAFHGGGGGDGFFRSHMQPFKTHTGVCEHKANNLARLIRRYQKKNETKMKDRRNRAEKN